jgi:hypothetical protein
MRPTIAMLWCGILAAQLDCSSPAQAPLNASTEALGGAATGGTAGGGVGGSLPHSNVGAGGDGDIDCYDPVDRQAYPTWCGGTSAGGTAGGGAGGAGGVISAAGGGAGGVIGAGGVVGTGGGGEGGAGGGGALDGGAQDGRASGTGGGTAGAGGAGGLWTLPVGGGGGQLGGRTGSMAGLGTLCPPPQQVITDFTYAALDAGTSTSEPRFGSPGTLQGGVSYYPNAGSYPLTVDVTKGNFHITGTVGDYSGFGLYFENCNRVDASSFQGISFAISGSVQGSALTFGMGTVGDTPSAAWLRDVGGKVTATPTDAGRCIPTSGNQYYHPGCVDPLVQISATPSPSVRNVLWSDFTGGAPEASVTPSEIVSIYWYFPWSSGATPYPLDLVIDDLQFIP